MQTVEIKTDVQLLLIEDIVGSKYNWQYTIKFQSNHVWLIDELAKYNEEDINIQFNNLKVYNVGLASWLTYGFLYLRSEEKRYEIN